MAESGRELKAWQERVTVLPHLSTVFRAFFDLSPGRPIHQGGEGYIPAQEIEAYCRLAGIEGEEDRLDFFRTIRAMDAAFMKDRSRRREEAEKKAKEERGRPPAGRP